MKFNAWRMALPLGAVMTVAACGAPGDDADLKVMSERRISTILKDPNSAKFDRQFIVRKPPADKRVEATACGLVNGKNSFGAYAGSARYAVHFFVYEDTAPSIIWAEIEGGDNLKRTPKSMPDKPATIFEDLYWNKHCTDDSHPATYTARIE